MKMRKLFVALVAFLMVSSACFAEDNMTKAEEEKLGVIAFSILNYNVEKYKIDIRIAKCYIEFYKIISKKEETKELQLLLSQYIDCIEKIVSHWDSAFDDSSAEEFSTTWLKLVKEIDLLRDKIKEETKDNEFPILF